MFLYLFEGLALIVFGIRFLRKGLDRLFGSKLSVWLANMTKNRWQAFGAGIAAGVVAPSSTALAVLSLQMLQTGRLTTEKMLALLLGSGVGMTVTIQLMANGLSNEAGYFLLFGVIGFQFLNRELYRGIGQCLFAMGLLFLGLEEIGNGAKALATNHAAQEFLTSTLSNPAVAIVSAALIAVLLQSSTATIGLAIGLAAGGVFSNASEIPWIVGTNLGVSLTSLLVGWKSWDGRRLGAATLAARLVIAIPLILLANPILAGLSHMPLSPIQRIAFLQTGFNLIVGLCAIPFLGPIIVGVRYFVAPQPGTETPKEQKFLDEAALSSPSMALAQATRQIQLMADMVGTILDQYWIAETTRNTDLAKRIQSQDVKIDGLNTDLNHYLSRIGEGMSPEDTEWQFTLLAFANELESVGDIIDKHLCDSVLRRAAELVPFSPSDQEILAAVQAKLVKRFQRATAFLSWRDKEAAKEFLDDKEKFNEECRLLEKDHFHRLRTRDHITLGSSPYFLDILNSFRRINSHISSIAYSFEL